MDLPLIKAVHANIETGVKHIFFSVGYDNVCKIEHDEKTDTFNIYTAENDKTVMVLKAKMRSENYLIEYFSDPAKKDE